MLERDGGHVGASYCRQWKLKKTFPLTRFLSPSVLPEDSHTNNNTTTEYIVIILNVNRNKVQNRLDKKTRSVPVSLLFGRDFVNVCEA